MANLTELRANVEELELNEFPFEAAEARQELLEAALDNLVDEMAQLMAFGFWDEAERLLERMQTIAEGRE